MGANTFYIPSSLLIFDGTKNALYMSNYQVSKQFKNLDISALPMGEYEDCVFTSCIFSDADLSDYIFADCNFVQCDLSNAKLNGCAFRDVQFKDCKMMGLHFDECNTFSLSFSFHTCVLDYSSFYKLKIKKTAFKNCRMTEVDFTETNLNEASFDNSDLSGTIFMQSNLEKADFRAAINFSIDPQQNFIRKARFLSTGLAGLLHNYQIVIE